MLSFTCCKRWFWVLHGPSDGTSGAVILIDGAKKSLIIDQEIGMASIATVFCFLAFFNTQLYCRIRKNEHIQSKSRTRSQIAS